MYNLIAAAALPWVSSKTHTYLRDLEMCSCPFERDLQSKYNSEQAALHCGYTSMEMNAWCHIIIYVVNKLTLQT
jgi:hypothetical protein